MSASAQIADVLNLLHGEPVFLAGSLVAEDEYGLSDAHSDIDIFTPSSEQLIATVQFLLGKGFELDDRHSRVWARWRQYGLKSWHTNSIRMLSPGGDEYNVVYKLIDGHPTTSLAQVLESFDFGLLGVGYDLQTGRRRDMRSFLFPDYNISDPLPMMPSKRDSWRQGFMSQYVGIREFIRYAKYARYGYDMSEVKDDLFVGYNNASAYLTSHFDAEKQQLGEIYFTVAEHIRTDDFDAMTEAGKKIDFNDALDQIMEALV